MTESEAAQSTIKDLEEKIDVLEGELGSSKDEVLEGLKENEVLQAKVDEAIEWFEKAARKGHAEAQYRLGDMYDEGDGVAERA